MTDILAALKEKTASAPTQQRKLSEYILSNSNYVCLMTVKELSEKSGVGRATIMRLVERLGYASYSDFKRDLNDTNLTYFDSDKLANPFIWPHQGEAAEQNNSVDACCQESVWLIQQVAEKLDMFEYIPGAQDPDDVGREIILNSGHFEVDPNLEDYIDYEAYGLDRLRFGEGEFSPLGYVGYTGDDRLFFEQEHQQQMGGMS